MWGKTTQSFAFRCLVCNIWARVRLPLWLGEGSYEAEIVLHLVYRQWRGRRLLRGQEQRSVTPWREGGWLEFRPVGFPPGGRTVPCVPTMSWMGHLSCVPSKSSRPDLEALAWIFTLMLSQEEVDNLPTWGPCGSWAGAPDPQALPQSSVPAWAQGHVERGIRKAPSGWIFCQVGGSGPRHI